MNSRQQVHIFLVPSTDLLYLWDLMLASYMGFARTSQECYFFKHAYSNGWLRLACNDAMPYMWGSARVQPMLFPDYELCYHQLLSVTLPCAISQLSHGCRCNLVREWGACYLLVQAQSDFLFEGASRIEAGELHVYRSIYLWGWILDSQVGMPWMLSYSI